MRHLLLLLLALPGWALQTQNMDLISPITGQKFEVIGVPLEQKSGGADLADLGADDDGCRHTSGPNEYDYYIAVCPFSYFSALSAEWDARSGRFREDLPTDMKDWVIKTFNTDWQLDHAKAYSFAQQSLRMSGQQIPARKDFVMGQQVIAIEKKYKLALQCYEKRGARAVVLGKIALTGAWALRSRMNLAIGNQVLDGGYEEVNDLVNRQVKPGEAFVLAKWLPIYRKIFNDASLTNEGYFVAGMTYFGFVVRDGDLAVARQVLEDMSKRFSKEDKPTGELLRGLVRERTRMLDEYAGSPAGKPRNAVGLLNIAAGNLIAAISTQEFPRMRLPPNLMAVAECLRRAAKDNRELSRAYDWYLALSKMPETQPSMRDDIRAQGKAPGPEAPFHVSLGWLADTQMARLRAAGVEHGPDISGPDAKLLAAIVFEHFGSAEYVDAGWRPRADGNQTDCALILNLVGQATMDFTFRGGAWPKSLDDLWEHDVLKDRNRVNRFHCPVTGERLNYVPLPGDVTTASPRTVIVATVRPVPTAQGPRYGAYLANNQLVWSEVALKAGSIAK